MLGQRYLSGLLYVEDRAAADERYLIVSGVKSLSACAKMTGKLHLSKRRLPTPDESVSVTAQSAVD